MECTVEDCSHPPLEVSLDDESNKPMKTSHYFVVVSVSAAIVLSGSCRTNAQTDPADQFSLGDSSVAPVRVSNMAAVEPHRLLSQASSQAQEPLQPSSKDFETPAQLSPGSPPPRTEPIVKIRVPTVPTVRGTGMPSAMPPKVESDGSVTPTATTPQLPIAAQNFVVPVTAVPIANSSTNRPAAKPAATPSTRTPTRVLPTLPKPTPNRPAVTPVTQTPARTTPTPARPTPTPSTPPVPPTPANATPPVAPAEPAVKVTAPPYLNPSSNPLQFPTKPEEVQLQGIQPITLQQALELAQRNNRTLQVSRLQLESSRAALREAQAAEFPTLGVQSGLTFQDSAQARFSASQQSSNNQQFANQSGFSGSQQSQSTTSLPLTGTVSLSYDLLAPGRSATIQASERQVRFNELEVERQFEDLRLNVATDYYALQQADEQVRISNSAVTNARASLRDAQAREQAGVGTRFDVLQFQVQLANANQDLVNSISQQRIARRQLAQRLSLSQVVDVSAADPVQAAGTWNLSLEDSIIAAFKNRAELEQQLVQREINQSRRNAALAALSPSLSLVASYNVFTNLNATPNPGLTTGYSIGANLNWTLFDGGASQSRAEQQEANIAIAETRFADLRNQVRFAVEQAYSNLQANSQNIQTSSLALTQATESLRLARLRFQAGVGTQLEVSNAETELTRAEVNRLQAILNYNRALTSLQRAISNIPVT